MLRLLLVERDSALGDVLVPGERPDSASEVSSAGRRQPIDAALAADDDGIELALERMFAEAQPHSDFNHADMQVYRRRLAPAGGCMSAAQLANPRRGRAGACDDCPSRSRWSLVGE
jgi:hypothetical protein